MRSPVREIGEIPAARLEFARRLRDFRQRRGFRTARSLARALGIEENRYTRYERAEVEPDLNLIRRIGVLLRITPNDLLGVAPEAVPGFGEVVQRALLPNGATEGQPSSTLSESAAAAAWALALEIAGLRAKLDRTGRGETGRSQPLDRQRAAAAIFQDIGADPYRAMSTLLSDAAVERATTSSQARISRCIETLTKALAPEGLDPD